LSWCEGTLREKFQNFIKTPFRIRGAYWGVTATRIEGLNGSDVEQIEGGKVRKDREKTLISKEETWKPPQLRGPVELLPGGEGLLEG